MPSMTLRRPKRGWVAGISTAAGNPRRHDLDREDLHRSAVDHQRSGLEVTGYRGDDLSEAGHRDRKDDQSAACRLHQAGRHVTVRQGSGCGRAWCVGPQTRMRCEVLGDQAAERVVADEPDRWVERGDGSE